MTLGIYDYEDEIRAAADRYGMDPIAMLNLGQTESAGNPYAVSPAGAGGLFQHMPGTAQEMGINRFIPGQSIDGGVGYFDKMTDKYESPLLADVAYNWGPGNLDNLMEREGTRDLGELYDDLPKETQDHLYKVWHPSSDPENDSWLKGSLPDAPEFNASRYRDVELRSARMPYSSRRGEDLSRVTGEITALEDQKRGALEEMTKQGELDPDQALAIALTAIVPALLGFGFGGGLQGAAMGAQAGAQGAGVGLQGLTSEMNRRDNSNKLLYEDAKSQLSGKQAEAKSIRDSISDREERNMELDENRSARREELEFLYGKDGVRRPVGARNYSPEVTQALADAAAGKPLRDEQLTAIYANPRAVDDLAEMRKRADIGGRAKDRMDMQRGGQVAMGYERLPNAPTLTTTEQRDMRMRQRGAEAMIDNLEQQKELIRENGTFDLVGTSAALEKMLQAEFMNLGRIRTNSGATFTETEQEFVNALQAATAAGTSVKDALRDLMTNRDPTEMIDAAQRLLKRGLDVEMLTFGQYNPSGDYSDTLKQRYKIGGGGAAGGDLQSFIADARKRGLSKEQARAEWEARK